MSKDIRAELINIIKTSLIRFFPEKESLPINLEVPGDKKHGDFSCNIALQSAKVLRQSPLVLAEKFLEAIQLSLSNSPIKEGIQKIEIKAPGFINFYLSRYVFYDILENVLTEKNLFGKSTFGQNRKIQIEFVSANPTGPLSVAHARQATVGDCLAKVFCFIGFNVEKEYYVNDEGNQIFLLGQSIRCRAQEQLGGEAPFINDGYQGTYVHEIAKEFLLKYQIQKTEQLEEISSENFSQFGVDYLLNVIKAELKDFKVSFDQWAFQSQIASNEHIQELILDFQKKDYIYEKDGALWFKSKQFGDDKDRVVKKSDGSYTYFTPDIVYHKNKYHRGFEKVINIWGPDHHGYIPRMKAAVIALGLREEALEVLIVQLATLYRDGQPIQMSTRKGQYISMREVIEEVGVDAARFFFLMRSISAHLDFDLELAKQQTQDNPVYYIQYAHARIASILLKAEEESFAPKTEKFELLQEEEELDLIKKIGSFPEILLSCYNQSDVFPIVNYLLELATCFHRFYDRQRVIDKENLPLSAERMGLIDATRIVIANGLDLLGISHPEKM